jgi:hypothetical protein
MAGPRYTSEIFGSNTPPPPAPVYTVSTFSGLPLTGEWGQKISVTAETLFNNSYPVIVTYENSNSTTGWKLLSARCTYVTLAAAEFNSGNWVGSATIPTSTYASITDTDYLESWTWNSTGTGTFLPSYLSLTTIDYQKKIKGDTVTLDAGWTKTEDTGCSVTTDGSKLTLAATGSGAQRVATVSFADAGSTNTTNFYMKCLFQRTDLVAGSSGASHTTMDYWPQSSGGFAAIFGDSRSSDTVTYPNINGKFFNKSVSWATNITKTSSTNSTLSSEILIQYRAYDYDGNGNIVLQVKIGREGWRDILSTDLSAGAGPFFKVGSYAKGTGGSATCKVRYLQAIRYT